MNRNLVDPAAISIDQFVAAVDHDVNPADFPLATSTAHRACVYDAAVLRDTLRADRDSVVVHQELAAALSDGPGIIVLKGAVDAEVIDRATAVFHSIIDAERATNGVRGDHYGKPGANDRIWNALEKLAVADPEVFVQYYANDMIALGAVAWLGPGYQITSQVNVVNPGGEAQQPHRDYHLGFMTDETAAQYPAHTHLLSPALTLQGAVAHGHTPVESGPTKYLPHSHKFPLGYLAWRRPEFIEYFEQHYLQVPLSAGDLVYFNPALFHAAGSNHTADIRRMANLLQVNSAFGRTMETVDRRRVSAAVYPALLDAVRSGLPADAAERVVAASADGYAFPTNLDRDQPVGRLTPDSQADVMRTALAEGADPADFAARLAEHAARRATH